MSRSAVSVSTDRIAALEKLSHKCVDLEERLAKATTKPETQQYRFRLCEALGDWVLTDPESAVARDVTGRLWRTCFYARIKEARINIAKHKRRGKCVRDQEESLNAFLREGVTLYDFLSDKLWALLEHPEDDEVNSQKSWLGESTVGIVPCLHRIAIGLGDFHRYAGRLQAAAAHYTTASRLAPGDGHARNQLAVVHHDQVVTAVYWYCRALASPREPFATAASNLARLFKTNRAWLAEQDGNTDDTGAATSAVLNQASKVCLSRFVQVQHDILESRECNAEVLLNQFRELLQNSAFGDSLLCKLATIAVYTNHKSNNRTFVVCFGLCLADRVATILEAKNRAVHASPPSIRVLLPLTVLTEFLLLNPCGDEAPFWKKIVEVFNGLITLNVPLNGQMSPLKEYQQLLGFAPFEPFLKDGSDTVTANGYLKDDAALALWEELKNQATQETQTTSTTASPEDAARIKIVRFLGLKRELLEMSQISLTSGGRLEWTEEDELMNDDVGDATMTNEAESSAVANHTPSQDVLVYTRAENGRPALLVPSALLNSNETGATTIPAAPPLAPLVAASIAMQPPLLDMPLQQAPLPPPPGFDVPSNLGFASTDTGPAPTVGESSNIFGGQSALQTSNPFAAARSFPQGGFAFNMEGRDNVFLQETTLDSTSLLGSSLLHSLLMEDSPQKASNTKNPFAT